MGAEKQVLAFDFGASSGRAILGKFDGKTITLQEVHRFANDPVMMQGTMYWDILRLFHEIKQGLIKAKSAGVIDSIGIDTWGVDFGLLDADGRLLENPVHYRDGRTVGMLEESFTKMERETFYKITGNQFMEINTAFQLLSLRQQRPEFLERAQRLLLMPDLLNYLLSGEQVSEYSIASTTQLLAAEKRVWSDTVLEELDLPKRLFAPIVPSGTKIGTLTKEICEELSIPEIAVVAVAGHDTQCAMAAVPTTEADFIFLSCGTWSLLGTELAHPLINEKSAAYNITNEGGADGKISFLKNIIGLWLIQESRRQWIREGRTYSFGELERLAEAVGPFGSFIDPDAPEFVSAGDIPSRIKEFCRRTGQKIPQTEGEVVRCIDESLAMKYRIALEEIEDCTNRHYPVINIIGGGAQSSLLCRLTAEACQRTVVAGAVEATAFGNIVLQLMALGEIKTLCEAREIIARSQELKTFAAAPYSVLAAKYEKFKGLIVC